jgi:hypothetical protein
MILCTISQQRSGTKMLGAYFNNGMLVRSYGEVFWWGDKRHCWLFPTFLANEPRYSNTPIEKHLNDFFDSLLLTDRHIHFDLMYNQTSFIVDPWWDKVEKYIYNYIKMREVGVIHLKRDLADVFCSHKYLCLSGVSHFFEHTELHNKKKGIELDLDEFEAFRRETMLFRNEVDQVFSGYSKFINLSYDEILPQKKFLKMSVQKRLIATMELETDPDYKLQVAPNPMLKTPVDYSKVFKNYIELKQYSREADERMA